MDTVPALLKSRLRAALAGIAPDAEPNVAAANDTRFGDYQTNIAMILAKPLRANPRQVAQDILAKLDVADCCDAPEIAGAGFINFRLRADWLAQRANTLAADERLGVPSPSTPRTIVIDFSSPNVAKPMHVGHIRSTILGDSLARIAEFIGHRTVRDNHIGDWGKQFGMLLVAWKAHMADIGATPDSIEQLEKLYKAINARIMAENNKDIVDWAEQFRDVAAERLANAGGDLDFIEQSPEMHGEVSARLAAKTGGKENAAAQVSRELVKLQNGDAENLALWREMIRISQKEFDSIYSRLGVRFDVALGESFYNPQLKDIVAQLRERGIARESEGAWCVFSDDTLPEKEDPFLIKDESGWKAAPALVQKADGAANYTTTDLATLEYRLHTWSPDEIIYVTDGRQQHHFRQLFAIFRRWHPELAAKVRLAHVWFGSILGDDGKPFKTRSGDTVKLSDLLDEAEERALALVTEKNPALPEADRRDIARIIGLGAVKYADLLPNRQTDYVFSWEKMLSFQGNTAPYLQNAYVRIRAIFRKAEDSGISHQPSAINLTEPAEMALAKKLLQFGEVLPQVMEDYRPNLLANYLYELATTYHSFYEACPVLKAESATRASRLTLCDTTARILRRGLSLLGIEVPERM